MVEDASVVITLLLPLEPRKDAESTDVPPAPTVIMIDLEAIMDTLPLKKPPPPPPPDAPCEFKSLPPAPPPATTR
jgi:hypothetical protein